MTTNPLSLYFNNLLQEQLQSVSTQLVFAEECEEPSPLNRSDSSSLSNSSTRVLAIIVSDNANTRGLFPDTLTTTVFDMPSTGDERRKTNNDAGREGPAHSSLRQEVLQKKKHSSGLEAHSDSRRDRW
jgi:hypothetical protein